jgi:hypothetical protein
MIDMLMTVAMLFALAFLDALSTYVVITLGVGVEANPAVADVINSNPATVFPLALISATIPSVALYVAVWLSDRLPARLGAVARRLLTSAFLAAAALRAAVVVNNLLLFSRH